MLELQTEMEKFLYDERKTMMKERDNAREELKRLKEENKPAFSVFRLQELDESNGGYHHPTHLAKLFIKKGDVNMTLTPEEIKQVVYTAGGNFRR